jgi:GTP pyrophosphokinase
LNFIQAKPESEDTLKITSRKKVKGDKNGIVVDGVGSLLSHVAKCCQPVPGDEIVGYITQGRGIAVHRSDCESFAHICEQHPEREIAVSWSDDIKSSYALNLRIEAQDRQGLIRDISSVLANEKVNVLNMNLQTNYEQNIAVFLMQIEVSNLSSMNRLITKLVQIDGVFEAKRRH